MRQVRQMSERQQQIASAIGSRILALRTERGWSQERLAREIRMSRETVRAAEAGERIPEWETLELIADAFGVSLGELLGFGAKGRKLRAA
jgi:transcriptional regulator with XRE-family HTH domain